MANKKKKKKNYGFMTGVLSALGINRNTRGYTPNQQPMIRPGQGRSKYTN